MNHTKRKDQTEFSCAVFFWIAAASIAVIVGEWVWRVTR